MKKAFTLVELLGVIIILGVLALITFPIIDKSIKNSKEKALERAIDNIEEAAYNYSITNDIGYETFYNKLSLEELKKAGFLEKETINPVTNENMNGCVLYKWNDSKKQYEFKYDEPCSVKSIYETVLEQFPYLATNGNGCVTPTDNNYSYMGGCYLKGSKQSGKDIFYSLMLELMDEETITQTFFDSEENFKSQEFESWFRNFAIQQGSTEEEIDQMLQESGKNTIFEATFNMTPEELFAQKALNNLLWYSGFLWRIMGINADGTVRLISEDSITAIPYHKGNSDWNTSYIKDWLNNYFYPKLKGNDIIIEQTWCSEATIDENSKRIECINNLSTEKSKVGLITLDEINLSESSFTRFYNSHLLTSDYFFTMTPYNGVNIWTIRDEPYIEDYGTSTSPFVRAIINIKSDSVITSGNGELGTTWNSKIGPYILNEDKNAEIAGKLREKAVSGEYVMFAGKKYRVVDKDSNGNIKIILDGLYEEDEIIFEMKYNDEHSNKVFSTTTGIGKKLNTDVLEWLVKSNDVDNRNKMVIDYIWYQNDFYYGNNYKVSLEETNPTRSIQATVGLIRVGEMLSGQSSSILTKGYSITDFNNTYRYWTMTSDAIWTQSWIVDGSLGIQSLVPSNYGQIRPVIVIKSDVTITGGNGTWSNPYKI